MTVSTDHSAASEDRPEPTAQASAADPPIFLYNSPELAAWHEAGHAETALRVGARIVEIQLKRDRVRSYGRVRADRTDEQSRHILLGGFAAEVHLYLRGRLRNADGSEMAMKQFIDGAIRNAADDLTAFWKLCQAEAASLDEEGRDRQFMSYARGMAERDMDMATVDRIATALLANDYLDEAAVIAVQKGI